MGPAECHANFDDLVHNTTTINQKPLPGTMARLVGPKVMIDVLKADGMRLLVTKGTRKAGTRVGIHYHKFGGHTCVLSGVITDYIEGLAEPVVFPAGTCYYMSPGTLMSAANLGVEDAELIDTFSLPPGEKEIRVVEPGY